MNTAAPHVFFYSINRLLPQQDEECWENDTAVSDFSFSDESEYNMKPLSELLENLHRKPTKSILHTHSSANSSTIDWGDNEESSPSNKNLRFSLDVEIYTRPRTSSCDKPELYYNEEELRLFKEQYRQQKKIEKLKEFHTWLHRVENSKGTEIDYPEDDEIMCLSCSNTIIGGDYETTKFCVECSTTDDSCSIEAGYSNDMRYVEEKEGAMFKLHLLEGEGREIIRNPLSSSLPSVPLSSLVPYNKRFPAAA